MKLKPQSQTRVNTIIRPSSTKVANRNQVAARNQIVEATGWIVDKNGNIEFVAQGNLVNSQTPWNNPADCALFN